MCDSHCYCRGSGRRRTSRSNCHAGSWRQPPAQGLTAEGVRGEVKQVRAGGGGGNGGGLLREQRSRGGAVRFPSPSLSVSACSLKQNSSNKCGASGYRLVKLQRRL